jgi:hypothetical protein
MRTFLLIAALASLALVVMPGCSEDHITNNTNPGVPGETGLVGRVIPAEPGIVLALWQAAMIRQVTADDSGYYKMVGMASGMYELRVTSPGGPAKIYYNVVVLAGTTRTFNINLEDTPLPPLFYDVYPGDGATGVSPLDGYIALASRSGLDLTSFDSAVVITPPVAGEWRASGYIYDDVIIVPSDIIEVSASGEYYFRPDTQFTPATEYTVRILPGLRLADGSAWGDSMQISFTVDSLRVDCLRVGGGYCGDTTVPLRQFDVYLRFNAVLNIDSLNAAAFFAPSIDGIWYRYDRGYYGTSRNEAVFFYTEPLVLRAEQTYTLTIDGDVGLSGQANFGIDREWDLVTEPVRVVGILPPIGSEAEVTTWIEVEFNTRMDHASAEAALTVSAFDGPMVAGQKVWIDEYKLTFRPDDKLVLGQAYQVEVENTAESLAGDTIRDEAYSFFRAAY